MPEPTVPPARKPNVPLLIAALLVAALALCILFTRKETSPAPPATGPNAGDESAGPVERGMNRVAPVVNVASSAAAAALKAAGKTVDEANERQNQMVRQLEADERGESLPDPSAAPEAPEQP